MKNFRSNGSLRVTIYACDHDAYNNFTSSVGLTTLDSHLKICCIKSCISRSVTNSGESVYPRIQ